MRPTRSLLGQYLAAILFIVTAPPLFSQEKARDIIPIGENDTIEVMRQKIAHNGYKFTVGHNWFFDWISAMDPETKKEYFARQPSDPSPRISDDIGPLAEHLGRALPSKFDLRNYNGHSYIGPPKSQGYCNTCWCFGAIAAAEGAYNWTMGLCDKNSVILSESFIIYCVLHNACMSGSPLNLEQMKAIVDYGVCSEADFPYTVLEPGSCEHWLDPRVYFASYHRVPCNDIEAIKTAIFTYGAVMSHVYLQSGFSAYSGGIFEDSMTTCPGPEMTPNPPPGFCWESTTGHVISLVGWDDNGDEENSGYWILRNSYGPTFGENGYMRIKYRSAHVACDTAYFVCATPTPTPTSTPTAPPAPTATPTPRLLGEPSSANPSVGEQFSFGALCRPLPDTFDAYGVAADQRGNIFSFNPADPQETIPGLVPIALSVRGLSGTVQETLYYAQSLPVSLRGASYTFTLCLVPAGAKPQVENAIPGYLWQGTVTVK